MPVCKVMPSLARLFLMAAVMLTPAMARAESTDILQQCWPDLQLATKSSERVIRRGVKAAFIKTPPLSAEPLPKVPPALQGSIRRVDLPEGLKFVALTFDLCEMQGEIAGYDGRIIDTLRQNNVKATFFSGGHWLLTHPERAQQLIADPRFEIASHSWTHGNMRRLTGLPLNAQITLAQAAYRITHQALTEKSCMKNHPAKAAALQADMKLFRFPYGSCSPEALRRVAEAGLLAIQWDLATGDPDKGQTPARIVSTVMRRVRPGSIILAHANGRGWHTAAALPAMIKSLKQAGYQFATVSELLAMGKPEIAKTCYDHKPGDTRFYEPGNRAGKQKKKPAQKQPKQTCLLCF